MASEDHGANFPRRAAWPSRLREAWLALLGRLGADANAALAVVASGRTATHPQVLLIETLIGGLAGSRRSCSTARAG